VPLSQPIRRKNKPNGDLLADVFPRFLSVTRDLSLALVHITVIGQSDYSGFRFTTSTHVCSTLTQTMSSSTVSCGPRGSWKSSPSSLSPGTGWTSCSFLPSSGGPWGRVSPGGPGGPGGPWGTKNDINIWDYVGTKLNIGRPSSKKSHGDCVYCAPAFLRNIDACL